MKPSEFGIVLRNMILGGNIESLLALRDPRRAAYYVGECRFLYECIFPEDGFVQKPVWEVFGANRVPVVLYGGTPGEWFHAVASYTADLVSMCMLCQILKPKTIFEIGTLHGASALHWAGNAPDAGQPGEAGLVCKPRSRGNEALGLRGQARSQENPLPLRETVRRLTSLPSKVTLICSSLMEFIVMTMYATTRFVPVSAANQEA